MKALVLIIILVHATVFAQNALEVNTYHLGQVMSSKSNIIKQENNKYVLIEPVSADIIGLFVEERPQYSKIIGYSYLGHIFLFNPDKKEYIVFYPFKQAAKSYGSFAKINDFENNILLDEDFSHYVLKPLFVETLIKHHGNLSKDNVFIPTPYFNHASSDVKDFDKGNIWVMLDLTNQMLN